MHDQSGGVSGRLLTVPELSSRIRMSKEWIYKEAAADRLPVVRCGRLLRFPEDLIAAMFAPKSRKDE